MHPFFCMLAKKAHRTTKLSLLLVQIGKLRPCERLRSSLLTSASSKKAVSPFDPSVTRGQSVADTNRSKTQFRYGQLNLASPQGYSPDARGRQEVGLQRRPEASRPIKTAPSYSGRPTVLGKRSCGPPLRRVSLEMSRDLCAGGLIGQRTEIGRYVRCFLRSPIGFLEEKAVNDHGFPAWPLVGLAELRVSGRQRGRSNWRLAALPWGYGLAAFGDWLVTRRSGRQPCSSHKTASFSPVLRKGRLARRREAPTVRELGNRGGAGLSGALASA